MKTKPLTIITINYNNANGLERTMASVNSQSMKDFEYIVIDGGSSDHSKDVIKQFDNVVDYWVSESDRGIYSAMNKGIRMSKGKFLYFLNSGDYLCDERTIGSVIENLDEFHDIFYGDLFVRNDERNKVWKQVHPKELTFSFFYNRTICHQACFFRRTLFEEIFYFNEEYKVYADWEFLIYAIFKREVPFKKFNMEICFFDTSGASSNPKIREKTKYEREKILNEHFPLLKEDYSQLKSYSSYRFEQLKQIENSKLARYVVTLVFKLLLLLLPSNVESKNTDK